MQSNPKCQTTPNANRLPDPIAVHLCRPSALDRRTSRQRQTRPATVIGRYNHSIISYTCSNTYQSSGRDVGQSADRIYTYLYMFIHTFRIFPRDVLNSIYSESVSNQPADDIYKRTESLSLCEVKRSASSCSLAWRLLWLPFNDRQDHVTFKKKCRALLCGW